MKATSNSNSAIQECQVCVTPYTTTTADNRQIKCPNPNCEFTACSNCYTQFITDHPAIEARCMEPSCKTPFSFPFIHHNFTESFATNTYSEQLKEIYFQKEQARLPETQELIVRKDKHVLRQREVENQSGPESELLYNFYREIQAYGIYFDPANEPAFIIDYDHCYDLVEHYIDFGTLPVETETVNPNPNSNPKPKQYSHQYHGKCPSTNCQGFITNEFICGICHTQVCHECLTQVDPSSTHTCNPTTVETVKAISSETKPCPTCHVPIYKIDGCSQIWCVQCHTAFCWNTGNIETQIHNPHYYEWMRTQTSIDQQQPTLDNPNQDHDQPPRLIRHFGNTTPGKIGEHITGKYLHMKHFVEYTDNPRTLRITSDQIKTFIDIYYGLCRLVLHYMNAAPEVVDLQHQTASLREEYLRGHIKTSNFKQQIFNLYRHKEHSDAFNQIVNTSFVEPVKTIFEDYLYELTNIFQEDIQTTITKFNTLLKRALEETESSLNTMRQAYEVSMFRFIIASKNHVDFRPPSKDARAFIVDLL